MGLFEGRRMHGKGATGHWATARMARGTWHGARGRTARAVVRHAETRSRHSCVLAPHGMHCVTPRLVVRLSSTMVSATDGLRGAVRQRRGKELYGRGGCRMVKCIGILYGRRAWRYTAMGLSLRQPAAARPLAPPCRLARPLKASKP